MKETPGNIWTYQHTHWIVIPTNIGYKADGSNIMGAGIAKTVRDRWPQVPVWYGNFCKTFGAETPLVKYIVTDTLDNCRLILFPSKPFNDKYPHLSWKSNSSLDLITRGAQQLSNLASELDNLPVVLPLIGCGMGGLSPEIVVPVLHRHLSDDRFILVR